jgi:hypothetical protein
MNIEDNLFLLLPAPLSIFMLSLTIIGNIFNGFPIFITKNYVSKVSKHVYEWCGKLETVPENICKKFNSLLDPIYCGIPCEYVKDSFSKTVCEKDCKKWFKLYSQASFNYKFSNFFLYILAVCIISFICMSVYRYSYEDSEEDIDSLP